jgi:hypothetical protein
VTYFNKVLLGLLALCCALSGMPAYAQSTPVAPATGDYTFGECSRIDRDALRGEIERAALNVLTAERGGIDIPALVARKWTDLGMDAVIDQEVARAVSELAADEGYLSRLWSGWSAEQAEEFATRIADNAFGSATFRQRLESLSAAIAGEIAQDIEADFARAASAAFLCMKAYVGTTYADTLFTAFENQVSIQVEQAEITSETTVDVSALDVHAKLLGGVGVIVVSELARRISQKLSQQIAQRVAGRIVGRVLGRAGSSLIPVAGWVIGIGMIVWDLWEGGKGALPQIEEALTGEEVKARIRGEIADSVKNSLPDETQVVALEIAVTLLEEWDNFCDRYPELCRLAEENATFQAILNDTPLDQLDKLALLVDVLTTYAGRAELDAAIQNGQLETALALPIESYVIIQSARSLGPLIEWTRLAGDRLDDVLAYGIHRQKRPADFSPELLAALLAVDDQAAIDKLLALDRAELEMLVPFAGLSLGPMAVNMTVDEIRQLVGYLQTPPPAATQIPPADLAPRLASRAVTVQDLLQPPTPTSVATVPTPVATPTVPAVGQPGGSNPVLIGSALLLALILAALGFVWLRRNRVTPGEPLQRE